MVRKAAHMGHQVADQDRANRSDQISVGLENLHGAEGWNVFRQRFDQPETSFLKQGHQRRANDRLGHRIEAEDRIGGHRRPRFLVAPAERARVHDFAAAGDERIDPCINAAIDIGLHCRTDTLKAPGAHSDRFRRFDCVVHVSSICGLWLPPPFEIGFKCVGSRPRSRRSGVAPAAPSGSWFRRRNDESANLP